jgi:hypothetical protein
MKAFAYALITTLALVLLVVATASAQGHPTDPGAVLIGTFQVTISVGNGGSVFTTSRTGIRSTTTSTEECQIKTNVTVWRTSTGAIDYIIDASSITYVGSCGSLGLTTADIFSLLSQAAVYQGIQLGYSSCPTDCSTQTPTRVFAALCVRRTGSGTSTHFEPCDMSSFCYREYTICCVNGTPQVTEVPRTGDSCGALTSGACETTCTESSKQLK